MVESFVCYSLMIFWLFLANFNSNKHSSLIILYLITDKGRTIGPRADLHVTQYSGSFITQKSSQINVK